MRSREQVLHLLAEASELEHNLLCSYLYAAFSLKRNGAEDLQPDELAAVIRWREVLMKVCIEEMVHLAQVSNLMVALGSRPHFNRPNLPVGPGYHPAGIVIELARFDLDTLDHFIFLERPHAVQLPDGAGFAPDAVQVERRPDAARAMPGSADYDTIGDFYGLLQDSLRELSAQVGEAALFCGSAALQLTAEEIRAPELIVVRDLHSAVAGIDFLVEQGEGSRAHHGDSHFERFCAMKTEYRNFVQRRPAFVPHRNSARNPVMHTPVTTDRVQVTDPAAAAVLDAANAAYGAMLRCLVQTYDTAPDGGGLRAALLGGALEAMHAMADLAGALSTMPAGGSDPAVAAGISFAMLRSTEGLAPSHLGGAILGERFEEIADRIVGLPVDVETRNRAAGTMARAAAALHAAGGGAGGG